MNKKRELKILCGNLNKEELERVVCPFCLKCNQFEIFQTESGFLSFRCIDCDTLVISTIKKS